MALDSSKVRVAVTGTVSIGGGTFVAPTDADTALTGATDLGYVGEDGVTESRERSTEKIRAWQNGATVREVVTEGTLTYKFVLLETKKETVELYYGGTVGSTNGDIVIIPTATGGTKKFVIDVVDGTDFIRVYVPKGEVTEVGEQVYASGEPIGYKVTITCYDDTTLGGSAKKFYSSLAA